MPPINVVFSWNSNLQGKSKDSTKGRSSSHYEGMQILSNTIQRGYWNDSLHSQFVDNSTSLGKSMHYLLHKDSLLTSKSHEGRIHDNHASTQSKQLPSLLLIFTMPKHPPPFTNSYHQNRSAHMPAMMRIHPHSCFLHAQQQYMFQKGTPFQKAARFWFNTPFLHCLICIIVYCPFSCLERLVRVFC